jgi:hypothetical protein
MRRFLGISLLVCLAVLGIYLVLLWQTSPVIRVESFPTLAEAITGDEIKDSWVPEFMPPSASEIWVRRGQSPSFMLLEFRFDPSDENFLGSNFEELTGAEGARLSIDGSRDLSWNTRLPKKVRLFKRRLPVEQSGYEFTLFVDSSHSYAWYVER